MIQCGKASNNFNFLQKFAEFEGKTIWKGKVSNNQITPIAYYLTLEITETLSFGQTNHPLCQILHLYHHVGKGSPMRGFLSSGDMSLLQPPPYQEEPETQESLLRNNALK